MRLFFYWIPSVSDVQFRVKMSKLNGIGKTHRKRFSSRPENFARPFNTSKLFEISDIKWMKILSIDSIVIKYLGIFCEGLKLIADGFRPLVNQFNYTFAYTNSFPISFLSTKAIWEWKERINKLFIGLR